MCSKRKAHFVVSVRMHFDRQSLSSVAKEFRFSRFFFIFKEKCLFSEAVKCDLSSVCFVNKTLPLMSHALGKSNQSTFMLQSIK